MLAYVSITHPFTMHPKLKPCLILCTASSGCALNTLVSNILCLPAWVIMQASTALQQIVTNELKWQACLASQSASEQVQCHCHVGRVGTEWVTGASDGSLAMWSQTKKRPTSVLRKAHGLPHPGTPPHNGRTADGVTEQELAAEDSSVAEGAAPVGPGSVGGDAASWIGAVGVCKGTDLVVSYLLCMPAWF